MNKEVMKNKKLFGLISILSVGILGLLVLVIGPESEVVPPRQDVADREQNTDESSGIASRDFSQANPQDQAQIQQNLDPGGGAGSNTCQINGGECVDNGIIDSGNYPNCQQISGTCGTAQTCCQVQASTDNPPSCPSVEGSCVSDNNSCSVPRYDATGCAPGTYCCVVQEGEDDSDFVEEPPADSGDSGNGDQRGGSLPGTPPSQQNFCGQAVTCNDACNEPCSSGTENCQTCKTADGSCSFKQACGSSPGDPIYSQTCGKGDFMDSTKKERKEEVSGYTKVACTGTSVCTGGPNVDGAYWCIEENPGSNDNEKKENDEPCDNHSECKSGQCENATRFGVTRKYCISNPSYPGTGTPGSCTAFQPKETSTCTSGCANVRTCGGSEEVGSCVDKSLCDASSNQPTPTDPPQDPTDPSNFPNVTQITSATNLTIGEDNKITVKVQGSGDKFYIYLHGTSQPKKGDSVNHNYNKNGLSGNTFYFMGETKDGGSITFDTPAQKGTYYIAINAMNYGPDPNKSEGEIVCSWHRDVFERGPNGTIDINNPIGQCANDTRSINVLEPTQDTQDPANTPTGSSPQGSTSGTREGLTVTAQPNKNCGGHVQITWTDSTPGNLSSHGYWIYRGNSSGFTPSGSNVMPDVADAGGIPTPRTGNPPYHDWASEPGKRYYYKVVAVDSVNSKTVLRTSAAAWSDTSSACGS